MSEKYQRKQAALQRKRKQPSTKKPRQRTGNYRIFVGVLPTGELANKLQAVRKEIDPKTAAITPPHVTLAGVYWRSGPATVRNEDNVITQLKLLAPKISPFELNLENIRTFGHRVLYLGVEQSKELLALRRALIRILGEDKHRRFAPHLTLAMRLERPLFDEALTKLRDSEWGNGRFTAPITQLRLMQRGPNDLAWRSIQTLPLGK